MRYSAEEIGDRIQKLRKEHNITQEYLADELGISLNHLGRVERGKKGASVDLLIEMSEYFNVSADYLLLGKPDNNREIKDTIHKVVTQLRELEKMIS